MGSLDNSTIYINIIDNGKGIDAPLLKHIQMILQGENELSDNHSVEIALLTFRIHNHYENQYGLTIENTESVGTTVAVSFPFTRPSSNFSLLPEKE